MHRRFPVHEPEGKRMGRKRERAACIVGKGKDYKFYCLQENCSHPKPGISLNCLQAFTCVLGGGVSARPNVDLCP